MLSSGIVSAPGWFRRSSEEQRSEIQANADRYVNSQNLLEGVALADRSISYFLRGRVAHCGAVLSLLINFYGNEEAGQPQGQKRILQFSDKFAAHAHILSKFPVFSKDLDGAILTEFKCMVAV